MQFNFFFSSRRRHTSLQGDWSSDVCSSDLVAGQFVFVRFGGGHGWEPHPFTISSAPQESLLHLSIKGRGDETQRLIDTLQPGVPARVGMAFGMFDYRRGGHKQVWIAGGIGITPFRSWIRAFPTEQPLEFDIDL